MAENARIGMPPTRLVRNSVASAPSHTEIAARSNNGCWTCRLRRKKCDEIRPTCSICASLNLECHGYGPRPNWMDNGDLQREQASKFKRLVSQAKSRRAKRQQGPTSGAPLVSSFDMCSLPRNITSIPISTPLDTAGASIGAFSNDGFGSLESGFDFGGLLSTADFPTLAAASPPTLSERNLGEFSHEEFEYLEGGTGLDSSGALHDPSNSWPSTHILSMDTTFDLDGCNPTATPPFDRNSVQQLLTPGPSENPLSFSPMQFPLGRMDTQNTVSQKDAGYPNTGPNHSVVGDQHQERNPPRATTPCETSDHSTPVPSLNGDTEDTLFMYYLDNVFYTQYPFYKSANGQGRGWLFAVLRRVKAAYHASLALSERHLLSTSPGNDFTTSALRLSSQNGHYDVAIHNLRSMIQDPYKANSRGCLISLLELLMSLLQAISFELSNGGREKWQSHLRTAYTFIPSLIRERMPMTIMLDPVTRMGCTTINIPPQKITLCPEVDSAFTFVLGCFLSLDILASASTRSPPLFSPAVHMQALDSFGISLEDLTGIRNPVMALILDVSLLDGWKKKAETENKLSIVDLAKRGAAIQERLKQALANIEDGQLNGAGRGRSQQSDKAEINKVFLLAAITYLHVVISGAYPSVPEISVSVEDTISAFRAISDPKSLHNMVWPFCVTGCLAEERHYDFFRGLISRARVTQTTAGTLYEALKVMEECWKARVVGLESCDWVDAMKRRGCYVFLT